MAVCIFSVLTTAITKATYYLIDDSVIYNNGMPIQLNSLMVDYLLSFKERGTNTPSIIKITNGMFKKRYL